jgi:transcriptional regulator with XRE-family HTH domain
MDASKPMMVTSERRGISRESRAFFKRLGKRIARMRQEKGMSQVQLGQIVGVSEEQVAEVEAGIRRPPLSVMPALAACLGIAISDLVDDKQLSLSPGMQRHIETIKRLSKADQRFVMRMAEILAR